ncbi:MAG: hypothetical protein BWY72_02402 [Bacteroidetes bacterium ADurb.Bin416]|nr:MAG: hypothetical protein BWY72_02402 [Bacteroidetes bacterium ADurb.Bin416]
MSIGIITGQVAVTEPQHPVHSQAGFQPGFDGSLIHGLIAVRGHQALGRCQQGTLTVALDTAAFQHEILLIFYGDRRVKQTGFEKTPANLVVEVGPEFFSPAIEREIQQNGLIIGENGNGAVIPGPGVVGR